ncbi:ABC transporter ATP-binding protein [Natrononativus amylolyticus]|uniref:ABC transporter ATP-binding protein n=1 Tax=Natrononativus amylolyticus TaxID=2963434 RepID=UPI0020CDD231|nr:ABC transporter ATP-binding protein [Natrononativus amylolyticus]
MSRQPSQATDTGSNAAQTSADGELILSTRGLTKRFGQFAAVDDVDLDVRRGEFRSIIGPNGAGKTTLFNLLSGALPATEGSVEFNGEDVTSLSPAERVRRGVGRSFQISNVFGGLTVRENVRLAAQAVHDDYGFLESLFTPTDRFGTMNDRTDRVLEQIQLESVADVKADALAYGDRRRLEIGVVLATDPEIVLFDEPTAGMSVEETRATIDLIEEVLEEQTLLLIEHDIELVMTLSDRITVLNRGEILAEGPPDAIAANETVQEAYLGGMVE